jgi:hypothetical protein
MDWIIKKMKKGLRRSPGGEVNRPKGISKKHPRLWENRTRINLKKQEMRVKFANRNV